MKLMESSKLERPGLLRQVLPLASTEYQTKEDVKPKSRYNDQICVMEKKKKNHTGHNVEEGLKLGKDYNQGK